MAQNVKDVGKGFACVVLFLLLYFVVGFSFDRSSALAILLAFLLFWRAFKPLQFEPYWVWIKPNWYQLLLDHGLIKDLEEWQQIVAKIDDASDYSVLRDGIKFTLLQPDLIFRNDRKEFSKYVKFSEFVSEVSLLSPGGWFYHPVVSVGFAIKPPPEGAYEIRITATNSPNGMDCNEKGVAVALLPWAEFSFYREGGEFNERRWRKLGARRDRRLQEYGWKREEVEASDYDRPSCIEHKYFTVQHDRI